MSQLRQLHSGVQRDARELRGSHTELEHRCAQKDFLLRTLADALVLAAADKGLRPAAAVRALREATFKPSYYARADLGMEALCRYIESGGDAAADGRSKRSGGGCADKDGVGKLDKETVRKPIQLLAWTFKSLLNMGPTRELVSVLYRVAL